MDPAEAPQQILTAEEARKVQQKAVTNIVRSIAAGKPPTAAQLRIINSFVDDVDRVDGVDEWVGSYEKLGTIVGLHRASFPRIIKDHEGDPLLPVPRANGDHSLSAWRKFLAAHPEIKCKSGGTDAAAGDIEGEDGRPSKSQLEYEKLYQQCRELTRIGDEKAGLLIPKAEVEAWLTSAIEAIKTLLRNKLKNELPPKLEGLRAPEIAAKMDDVIAAVCRELRAAPRQSGALDSNAAKPQRTPGEGGPTGDSARQSAGTADATKADATKAP